jgi:hypothetical protein
MSSPTQVNGSRIRSWWMMSSRTCGDAVAVSASTGGRPSRSAMPPSIM